MARHSTFQKEIADVIFLTFTLKSRQKSEVTSSKKLLKYKYLVWFYQIPIDSDQTLAFLELVLSAWEVNVNCVVPCRKTTKMNHVMFLLKIPFSLTCLSEKLEVKKLGIHQTKLRKFSPSWLKKTAWLATCEERKSLYYFYCLLFGGKSIWSKAGYSDLKHLPEKKSMNVVQSI